MVMGFDPNHDRGLRAGDLQPLRAWLHDNPLAWLYPDLGPGLNETFTQEVTLLVGEAGSGKTTLLNLVRHQMDQPGSLVIHLDFTNASGLMGEVRKDDAGPKFAEMTRDATAASIHRKDLNVGFRAAKTRYLVDRIGHTAIGQIRERFGSTIDAMSDEDLLGNNEIQSAISAYESQTSDQFVSIQAAQFLPRTRTVLIVDNIDHLRPSWLIDLVLQKLGGILHSTTTTFVAIRSEHERAADALVHSRPINAKYSDSEDTAILRIASTRNQGALDYVKAFRPELLGEAQTRYEALENALSAIQSDPALLRLTTSWLNGNVRQMLSLFTELSLEINTATTKRASDSSSIAGVVYSKAIKEAAPARLIDVMSPQRVHTLKYRKLPFVFLPLRILAYVKMQNGVALQRKLFEDFKTSFGIDEQKMRSAVELLAEDHPSRPSLVRRGQNSNHANIVVLLPCGRVFIEEFVYSCDFLALMYNSTPRLPEINRDTNRSTVKLQMAVAYVSEILLPAFLAEHPYINPSYRISDSERVRLSAYDSMFNYGTGRWFVARLHGKLVSYARARNIKLEALTTLERRLSAAVETLDHLASGGR